MPYKLPPDAQTLFYNTPPSRLYKLQKSTDLQKIKEGNSDPYQKRNNPQQKRSENLKSMIRIRQKSFSDPFLFLFGSFFEGIRIVF